MNIEMWTPDIDEFLNYIWVPVDRITTDGFYREANSVSNVIGEGLTQDEIKDLILWYKETNKTPELPSIEYMFIGGKKYDRVDNHTTMVVAFNLIKSIIRDKKINNLLK